MQGAKVNSMIDDFEEQVISSFSPTTSRWLFGTLAGWIILALCICLVGLPFLFLIWLRNVCTNFTITDQRVKIQTGIIFKRIDEIELYRIKDVKVNFSLLNQMLNIGVVSLISSDATTQSGTFRLAYIVDAKAVRETLRNLVEKARRRRGVRELDMDPVFSAR
jgi:uncharacterized membrane protein YdbT with pleckstrin-like domain